MSRNRKRSFSPAWLLCGVVLGSATILVARPGVAETSCDDPARVLVLEPLHAVEASAESGEAVPAVTSVRRGGRESFEIAVVPVQYADARDPIRSGANDGGSIEIRIVRFGDEEDTGSLEGVRVCQPLLPDAPRARIPIQVDGPDRGSRRVPAPVVEVPAKSVTSGTTVAAISATLWQGGECDGRPLASSSYNPATRMLAWSPRLAGRSACSPTVVWFRREVADR